MKDRHGESQFEVPPVLIQGNEKWDSDSEKKILWRKAFSPSAFGIRPPNVILFLLSIFRYLLILKLEASRSYTPNLQDNGRVGYARAPPAAEVSSFLLLPSRSIKIDLV